MKVVCTARHRSSRPRLWPPRVTCILAGLLLPLLAAEGAFAKAHLWRFTELFSNASGSVQFIEMFVFDPAGTEEIRFQGFVLSSNENEYVFPNNLPPENTFNRWVLIATQEFAELPGAPAPDFIIPASFFDPSGDEIRYRDTVDIFTIPSGAMPTDGLHSLRTDLSTPVNSPTNFAGTEGSVDLRSVIPALPFWAFSVLAMALSALAVVGLRRGRS